MVSTTGAHRDNDKPVACSDKFVGRAPVDHDPSDEQHRRYQYRSQRHCFAASIRWIVERGFDVLHSNWQLDANQDYQEFVTLWKNADPEFQPQVAEVKKRLAQLEKGSGRRAIAINEQ